jgi:hypothetical protein
VDQEGFQGFGALGGAVFCLSLVRDEGVGEPQAQVFGEVWHGVDVGGDQTLAQHDVAEEAALGGVGEGAFVPGELAHLAHVVEDGPEDEEVAVHGVEVGQVAGDLQATYRVLQQTTDAGVVHGLGRGSLAELRPEIFVGDHGLEEVSQVLVLQLSTSLFQFRRQGPPVHLRGREEILFGDVFRPEEAQAF